MINFRLLLQEVFLSDKNNLITHYFNISFLKNNLKLGTKISDPSLLR